MKRAALTLALLVLAGCGGGGGATSGFAPATEAAAPAAKDPAPAERPPGKKDAAPCTVALWGDSIAGLVAGRISPRLEVHSHWIAGTTSGQKLPAFLQDPLAERFVVLEDGFNDANAMQPIEANFRSMLDRIKAAGRTPVLTGTSNATSAEFGWINATNATIERLAREYGAVYVNWPGVQWAPFELMSDGQHPGPVYAQRLADALSAAILAAAPECAP